MVNNCLDTVLIRKTKAGKRPVSMNIDAWSIPVLTGQYWSIPVDLSIEILVVR